jgi:hypothetical protein
MYVHVVVRPWWSGDGWLACISFAYSLLQIFQFLRHHHHCSFVFLTFLSQLFFSLQTTKKQIIAMSESAKEYTLEEIAKHNTQDSCWLIIGNVKTGTSLSLE